MKRSNGKQGDWGGSSSSGRSRGASAKEDSMPDDWDDRSGSNDANTGSDRKKGTARTSGSHSNPERTGRTDHSPDIEDRSTTTAHSRRSNNNSTPNDFKLTNSEQQALADAKKNGNLTSSYGDTGIGSLEDAKDDHERETQRYAGVINDVYQKEGLAALATDDPYSPVVQTMVGNPKLASGMKLNEDERSALVRDVAGKQRNGLLASASNLIPFAGSAINGVIDARQANQFSQDAWGMERTTGESIADGVDSGVRGLGASAIGAMSSPLVGPLSAVVSDYSTGLLAANIKNHGKTFTPPTTNEYKDDQPAIASTAALLDAPPGNAADMSKPAINAYDPSLSSYGSHLNDFQTAAFTYSPNTAINAWR